MGSGPWPPEDPGELDLPVRLLPKGQDLFRVHHQRHGPTEFNPGLGAGGRFHFVTDGRGQPVPSLYAAETVAAAVAETVFHDVPTRPREGRMISAAKFEGRMLSAIRTIEDLQVVELHHPGLDRLHLEPREISDTDPSHYPRTRAWAQTIHDAGACAGLVWMSRLHNTDKAYTFFGDRVGKAVFEPVEASLPLWHGLGRTLVHELAEERAILIAYS